ncbi:hypothetical protein Aca07nite_47760 [Actinoplanes capillaceus]|uniref:Integrase catalytic domain-containing protein n=1 Tax=Actinoplanes campanulatus TaxID=113559 RepID=A0ABQ3WMQ4_9ACTN|nr:IS3 family transposase [Actinoplanes capillaceus]GID47501.1 hypothetical protein Aca07nite_47760 [Actinoplanes capillaceus]
MRHNRRPTPRIRRLNRPITIKTELIHRQAWPTRKAAHQAVFEYIEGWYNTRRRHSTLGYLSPAAYEGGTGLQAGLAGPSTPRFTGGSRL